MIENPKYTTELSKGQGMIGETLAIMELWEEGTSVAELKEMALQQGVVGKATALRVKDIVGRVFASRFLKDDARPARNIKLLLKLGYSINELNRILFIHTARAHDILHDFATQVYWAKYAAGARKIHRDDALDFIERAMSEGIVSPRWSDNMKIKVAGYLGACLADFNLTGKDKGGVKEIQPFGIDDLTSLYLIHDIHFSGFGDTAVAEHPDWGLFGMEPMDARREMKRVARGHFIPQFSGDLIRVSWKYQTMEEAIHGFAGERF